MERVLIVEDNSLDALAAAEALHTGQPSYETMRADSLAEALAAKGYDAVVLDLGLPDSSGMDTVEAMLKATSAPIIVHSASGHDDLVRRALQGGCSDYVIKGRDHDLKRAVRHALMRSGHRQAILEKARLLREVLQALVRDWPLGLDVATGLPAFVADHNGTVMRATASGLDCLNATHTDVGDLMVRSRHRLSAGHSISYAAGDWDLLLTPRPGHSKQAVGIFSPRAQALHPALDATLAHHHFRTPLTPILMDVSTLSLGGGEDPRLRRIKENAARLQAFASQYVDVTALHSDLLPLHHEPIDLAPFLRTQGVPVAAPDELHVICDPRRTEDLVNSILSRGDASIEAAVRGDQVHITITLRKWEGPSPAQLLAPFEAPAPGDPGGLALHLGREVLRRSGGDLLVEADGEDMQFTLVLEHMLPTTKDVANGA